MSWVGIVVVSPYFFAGRQTDLLGFYGNVIPVTMTGIIRVFVPSGGSTASPRRS
jgi:hypothetical protein